jgi:hypothetical protein
MLGVNFNHYMIMTVFSLAGFAQVIVMSNRTFKTRAMKVTNVATITNYTSVA